VAEEVQDSAQEPGSSVLLAYLTDQLARQDARKASVEQRGLAVITTSGALVTLLFGLAALSTKSAATFTLPTSASSLLAVAILLFVIAAVTAILTNVPIDYQEFEAEPFGKRINAALAAPRSQVEGNAAKTNRKILANAQAQNDLKAKLLLIAMAIEVAAVALVGAAVGIVLNGMALWISVAVLIVGGVLAYYRAYGFGRPTGGLLGEFYAAWTRGRTVAT
jgi:hypothetical protein